MSTHPLDRITSHLGHPAHEIAAVARLAEHEAAALADLLTDAFRRQDAKVEEALQRSVSALPRILRGKVSKILFPEGSK